MAVAETSKQAYRSLKDLGDRQREVHDALGNLGIASNQDIADALNWSINRVTGRMHELAQYGYAEVHGTKMGKFGTPVKTWRCVNPNDKKIGGAVRWLDD